MHFIGVRRSGAMLLLREAMTERSGESEIWGEVRFPSRDAILRLARGK